MTRHQQLLLTLLVGAAAFAMYAQDYLAGALDGADDQAKPQRAACLRAHALAMRASIAAALVACLAAVLALQPGRSSLAVVGAGTLLGFAYNASWLPGKLAPKRAFTGAKVAYVAMTWALGCVVLPWTVRLDYSPPCPADARACSALKALLDQENMTTATGQGSPEAGAGTMPSGYTMMLLYIGVAAFTAATVHNADVPDIAADRTAGIKTIAAAVGRRQSVLVSAALALVGTAAGVATGCPWLAGVGPFALAATSILAGGWDELAIMLDDSQGILAGVLAAVLV